MAALNVIGLLVLFGAGLLGLRMLLRSFYNKPRRFRYGDEEFIWVPPEGSDGGGLFVNGYEDGSFQYSDGTPVTDRHQIAILEKFWIQANKPESMNDGG